MAAGGRLANVAGVVLDRDVSDAESVARVADLLAMICEDVMVVGGSCQLPGAARRILTADSSPLALLVAALDASDAARVLTVDPGMGVVRHADAGYPRAIEVAREQGIKIPMQSG